MGRPALSKILVLIGGPAGTDHDHEQDHDHDLPRLLRALRGTRTLDLLSTRPAAGAWQPW